MWCYIRRLGRLVSALSGPELAGLRLFDIARYECTASPVQSGIGLSADLSEKHHARAGCLGLKLGFPDGSMPLTPVTHRFVQVWENPETIANKWLCFAGCMTK